MTLEDYETRGALVGAADWAEVEQRISKARAAIAWLLRSNRSLRACEVFGPYAARNCKPTEWPPRSFCGLDNPLEHVEKLTALHEASGGALVTCGHATWGPCANSFAKPGDPC